MQQNAKHRAPRTVGTTIRRSLTTAVIGGATIIGGTIATAPSANAAPQTQASSVQTRATGGVWDRVAACESGGNWRTSTGNGYSGGLQFSASSWRAAGGTRVASSPHHAPQTQQIAAAQRLLRMQGPGAWPVCGPKAGLSRSNGGSSGGGEAASSRSVQRTSHVSGKRASHVAEQRTSHVSGYRAYRHQAGMSKSQIRVLQREVGARVDGIIGPETTRKTERYLDHRLTGKSYLSGSTLRGAWKIVRG